MKLCHTSGIGILLIIVNNFTLNDLFHHWYTRSTVFGIPGIPVTAGCILETKLAANWKKIFLGIILLIRKLRLIFLFLLLDTHIRYTHLLTYQDVPLWFEINRDCFQTIQFL